MYSIRTRSRAADIFNTCASLIFAMEDDSMVRINLALCIVCHPAQNGDIGNVTAKSEGLGPTPAPKTRKPLAKSHPGGEG